MRKITAIVAAVGLSGPLFAQGADPAEMAAEASSRLKNASEILDRAETGPERVEALTEAIRAYEDGLAALRDSVRRAATRQATLKADLDAREQDVTRLLGVLQTLSRTPQSALLLHPDGPAGTARSGLLLADVTPAIQQEINTLTQTLKELEILQALQRDAETTVRDGLTGVQQARAELSDALADRRDLPRRYLEDPIKTALLLASTETLDAFAAGLAESSLPSPESETPNAADLKGTLPLPVNGTVLRKSGEADAAGNVRPGIVIATRPQALVTAPTAATVRFYGELLTYGNVVILEPAPDVLMVLAGLGDIYAEVGTVLPQGAPIGLMGADHEATNANLTENSVLAPVPSTQNLYLEVREGHGPVNPALWFAFE